MVAELQHLTGAEDRAQALEAELAARDARIGQLLQQVLAAPRSAAPGSGCYAFWRRDTWSIAAFSV